MKKQYTINTNESLCKTYITTYCDGHSKTLTELWADEAKDYIKVLEKQGYHRAYTKEDVEQAKIHYEFLLENQVMDTEE